VLNSRDVARFRQNDAGRHPKPGQAGWCLGLLMLVDDSGPDGVFLQPGRWTSGRLQTRGCAGDAEVVENALDRLGSSSITAMTSRLPPRGLAGFSRGGVLSMPRWSRMRLAELWVKA